MKQNNIQKYVFFDIINVKGVIYERILIVLSLIVLFISGCDSDKEVITKCHLTNKDVIKNYELKSNYIIHSKNNEIQKVVTEEIIISDNAEMINYYEQYITSSYATMEKNYGGYKNKVTKENNKLISTTTIDYNVMNLDKLVEDNSAMKSYINDNKKFTLEGGKKIYESFGAECE